MKLDNKQRTILDASVVLTGEWLVEIYVSYRSQLFAEISFSNAALSFSIVSFKQVGDFFGWDWQVFAIGRLEKSEVVVKGTEAFHFFVNRVIEVRKVNLRNFVLPL